MTKIYETANGKKLRLNAGQFNKLATAIYNGIDKNHYKVVIYLNDEPDDSLVCYRTKYGVVYQRRVIMPEDAINVLPQVCFSATVYPPLYDFINMLCWLPSCSVAVFDSDGCICKKVFNLRGV